MGHGRGVACHRPPRLAITPAGTHNDLYETLEAVYSRRVTGWPVICPRSPITSLNGARWCAALEDADHLFWRAVTCADVRGRLP
jgi:hypothetical protein